MSKLWIVLLLVICTACGNPFAGGDSGFLPVAGEYPGLDPVGKRKAYLLDDDLYQYLGSRSAIFDNYGIDNFFNNDYTLNGPDNYLTIESAQIAGDNGAAGVFYYYVRRKLVNKGQLVDVGAQGVLDTQNENRNLYFFKGRWFFSIVYSGKGKIPDLLPIGRLIAAKVPGKDWKPSGFRYLAVDGISDEYAYVTPGNALNLEFLPPSVTTFVSSVGLQSNIFVSDFFDIDQAQTATEDFIKFLRATAEDYKTFKLPVAGYEYKVYQGIDEKEGLLMFVNYKKALITINQIKEINQAKLLLARVIQRIKDEESGRIKVAPAAAKKDTYYDLPVEE